MASRAVSTDLVVTGTVNATALQQGGAAVETAAHISGNGKGVVVHGAVAGTARPTGFASIEWIGTVEPTNAIDNDTWVDTDAV